MEDMSEIENRMTSPAKVKPFTISKWEVLDAWNRVRRNKGSAGIDGISIPEYEKGLKRNLYKLWNRLSSGSYFPQGVKRGEIPKKDGGRRPLGIPTVNDRIAQEVVRARLEKAVDPIFHVDSYGYRPNKSAQQAITICRERNWKYHWAIDLDIKGFFDTLDHELLMKAVRKHCSEKWMVLYIERWLKSKVVYPDGHAEEPVSGTPQGGVISPLLANLYLHYASDRWISTKYPEVKFERYADDIIVHCKSENEAKKLLEAIRDRMQECKLELHPVKTKIVCCEKRKYPPDDHSSPKSYDFLGYTFRQRRVRTKQGRFNVSFGPAASQDAKKILREKIRKVVSKKTRSKSIELLAKILNPIVRGWVNYFSLYHTATLSDIAEYANMKLSNWIRRKNKGSTKQGWKWLTQICKAKPNLFEHWHLAPLR